MLQSHATAGIDPPTTPKMTRESLIGYKAIFLKRTALLPYSRLYSLRPEGIGTPLVENLTCYVSRLSNAHCISVATLVGWEIVPRIGKAYMLNASSKFKSGVLGGPIRGLIKALNGVGDAAAEWVNILESLTLKADLRCLTMLTWSNVISERYLLRPARSWCPACLEEWRTAGQVVYEPLLWSLKAVEICAHHLLPLRMQCQHCNRPRLPFLVSGSRPGHCSRCGQWLGLPAAEAGAQLSGEELTWQLYVTKSAGEILTAAPTLKAPPARERIAEAISICAERLGGGSVAKLAGLLRIPRRTVLNWRQGYNVLQLDSLLRVCHRLGIVITKFLSGEIEAADPVSGASGRAQFGTKGSRPREPIRPAEVLPKLRAALRENPPPSLNQAAKRLGLGQKSLRRHFPSLCEAIKARYREYLEMEWDKVGQEMKTALSEYPPPSVIELAGRLERSKSSLYDRLPELCHAVAERYVEYRRFCSEEAKEDLKKEVCEIALKLYERGIRPSHSAVSKHLSRPGRMSRGEARGALRQWKAEFIKGI